MTAPSLFPVEWIVVEVLALTAGIDEVVVEATVVAVAAVTFVGARSATVVLTGPVVNVVTAGIVVVVVNIVLGVVEADVLAVVVGAGVTLNDIVCRAAGTHTASPAWSAVTVHLPVARRLAVAPLTEQTPGVADPQVIGREDVALAASVVVPPAGPSTACVTVIN
ncbi:MAG: hypothetical protein ACKOFT_10560 [Actinomycetota bacterium]